MAKTAGHSLQVRALVVLTATFVAVVVVAALYWAQVVFIPVAMALFISFLLSPLVSGLHRVGLARVPAVIVVVTFAALILGGTTWMVTNQVTRLFAELPQYSDNIRARIRAVQDWAQRPSVAGFEELIGGIKEELGTKQAEAPPWPDSEPARGKSPAQPPQVVVQPDRPAWLARLPTYFSPAVELLGTLGLSVVLSVFILLNREDLRNRFIRLVGEGNLTATTRAVDDAGARISRFLLMQLIVNGTYGLALGLGLLLIGVQYALLWGFFAAVLRYIPYIGAWIAAVLPIGLSLAAFAGWWQPLAVIGLFLVLELISNNAMEPWLFGQSIGVSEVALLVSAAFWAFLWGPVGMVLSAPLTVCLVVMGHHVPQLAFLDVLLGDEPALDPDVSFYQRLLAHDQDEAAQSVATYLEEQPREQVYDALLVPALTYAKRDRDRDELEEKDEQFLLGAAREIVDTLGDRQEDTAKAEARSAPGTPRVRIMGCPVRDGEDELALSFLHRLLDPTRWEVETISVAVLTGELIGLIEEKKPMVICLGALPPGGLSHTRYLCKKLRTRFADVKIIVGRWGQKGNQEENEQQLRAAGADHVTTSVLETQTYLNTLLPVLQEQQVPDGRGRVA